MSIASPLEALECRAVAKMSSRSPSKARAEPQPEPAVPSRLSFGGDMEMTGCVGQLITSALQHRPADIDDTMDMTSCVGQLLATSLKPQLADSSDAMEMTSCVGQLIKQASEPVAQTHADADMEMTTCVGNLLLQSRQDDVKVTAGRVGHVFSDADTAMEMTENVGSLFASSRSNDSMDLTEGVGQYVQQGGRVVSPEHKPHAFLAGEPSSLDQSMEMTENVAEHHGLLFRVVFSHSHQVERTKIFSSGDDDFSHSISGDADMSMTENVISFTTKFAQPKEMDAPDAPKAVLPTAVPGNSVAQNLQDLVRTIMPSTSLAATCTFEQIQQQLLELKSASMSDVSLPVDESLMETDAVAPSCDIVDEKPFYDEIEYTLNPKELLQQQQQPRQFAGSSPAVNTHEELVLTQDILEQSTTPLTPTTEHEPDSSTVMNATFEVTAHGATTNPAVLPVNQTFTLEDSFDQPVASAVHSLQLEAATSRHMPDTEPRTLSAPVQQNKDATLPWPQEETAPGLHVMPLKEFLHLIQVRFLDKVSSGRRTTLLPASMSDAQNLTLQQQMQLAHVVNPELELRRWACEHLSTLTDDLKSSITSLERTNNQAYQTLAQVVVEMDADMLTEFQRSMTTLKANSRAEARDRWNAFHAKLLHRISEAFALELDGLQSDEEIAAQHLGHLKQMVAQLASRKMQVLAQLSEYDTLLGSPEQIAECVSLSDSLTHGRQESNAKRAMLAEMQEAKASLEERMKQARATQVRLQAERQSAQAQLAAQTAFVPSDEVAKLRYSLGLLQACQHWKFVCATDACVTVDLFGFRIALHKDAITSHVSGASILSRPSTTLNDSPLYEEFCRSVVNQPIAQV